MSYHDVPIVVTDAMVTALEANIQVIINFFNDFEITEEDLKLLPKMGYRRYSFSVEAFQQARLFPDVLFHNRRLPAFDVVKTNYEKLAPVYKKFEKAQVTFRVVMQVLGSNTFTFGLDTYHAMNGANNDGVPGIEGARKALAAFFKGQGVQAEPTDESGAPFVPGNDLNATGNGNNGGAPA